MNIHNILDLTKERIESLSPVPDQYLVSKGSNNGFEKLVPIIMNDIASELEIDLKVVIHTGHHFPDLDLVLNGRKYGIELKSRNNGSWDTNGNSVFESISDTDYDEIFVFFGTHKKGVPRITVKYAPYWLVTSSIVVTHSPRFKINMETTQSVFSSAKEYENLRNFTEQEKVLFLQNYLRENTNGVRWFIPPEENTVKPVSLNSLNKRMKKQITAEVLVLFPQDLLRTTLEGKISGDYQRSSEYLIFTHYYYSSSFRDFFSASGQWEVKNTKFPQVIKRLYLHRLEISNILDTANDDFKRIAYDSWDELGLSLKRIDFFEDYKSVLNEIGKNNFPKQLKTSNIHQLSNFIIT